MAICPYECKDPEIYAVQRHQLGVRVRDGMPVRAAARVLNIPYSTDWRWAPPPIVVRLPDRRRDCGLT